MYPPLALLDLRTLLSARAALIPVTGGIMTGFAFALYRGTLGRLFTSDVKESESIMNFSPLGTLKCVCGEKYPANMPADRRQFCRSCGCEVMAANTAELDRHLSPKEIKAMTQSLRRAAIRASHLELPPTITTIDELHQYLNSPEPKLPRTPPSHTTQVGQAQVH